ncbi:putative endoplasmic reticulum oxidoreductin 1, ERO1-like superfamily [Helianthus anomalus]
MRNFLFFFFNKKPSHLRGECRHQFRVLGEFKRGVDVAHEDWLCRGANLQLMYDRVLNHPERVQNLYFTFFFVLGAITKAGPCLEEAQYDLSNRSEDLKVHSLIRKLLHNPKLQAVCPLSFDEAKLWQGQSGPELKQQIQNQFRNIRFSL